MSYYILQNDETKGPYTLGQLRTMWSSGSITRETLHSQEGYSEWIPLSSIIHELEPPPPPISPPRPAKPQQHYHSAQGSRTPVFKIFVGLVLVIGFIIVGLLDTRTPNISDSAETYSPKVAATASVSLSYDSIRVSNLDSFDWPRTSIYIDGIMGGYIYRLASIQAGKAVSIPLRDFSTRSGARFDPNKRKPKEVVVHPDGYDARQFNY